MLIAEILAQFLLFFGIYYFADCFYGRMDIRSLMLGGAWLVLYAVCTGILRKKATKLWLFVITHLLLVGITILCMLSNIWSDLLGFMMLLQVIYSFILGVSAGKIGLRQWGYAQAALLALLYLGDKLFYEKATTDGLWVLFFLYIIVLLFYRNRQAAEDYIEIRRRNTIMNEAPMKKVSKMISGVYVLLTGIFIFFISVPFLAWNTPDLNVEGDWAQVTLPAGMNGVQNLLDVMETTDGEVEEPAIQKNYEGFDTIITVIAVIFLVIVVIGVVYSIIQYVRDGFQKNNREEDKVDFINPFDKTESLQKKVKKEHFHVRKSNRDKVRHLYKKRMDGFWRKGTVLPDKTTPTMQWELKQQQEKEIPKELVDVYEKARYSQETITEEDVERMKK